MIRVKNIAGMQKCDDGSWLVKIGTAEGVLKEKTVGAWRGNRLFYRRLVFDVAELEQTKQMRGQESKAFLNQNSYFVEKYSGKEPLIEQALVSNPVLSKPIIVSTAAMVASIAILVSGALDSSLFGLWNYLSSSAPEIPSRDSVALARIYSVGSVLLVGALGVFIRLAMRSQSAYKTTNALKDAGIKVFEAQEKSAPPE